jgi:hypothetical protein
MSVITRDFSAIRPATRSLVRACAAYGIAAVDRTPPAKVVAREWSGDRAAEWLTTRAATTPTDPSNTPELVRTIVPELVVTLAAHSVAAQLFRLGLQLSFDGAGAINVPTLLGDSSQAAFVKSGDPIPVMQGKTDPLVTMVPHKVSVIVVLTSEMIRSSNIEALVLDALTRSAALALDAALFDANPDDGARPAGIRYGITELAASAAPNATDAMFLDIEAMCRSIEPVATTPILAMAPARATMARLRGYGLVPLMVLGSGGLIGSDIVTMIEPRAIASALDGAPEIATAEHSTAQMTMTPGPGVIERVHSMWQTDSIAILLRLPATWAVRSSAGIAWLMPRNW